MGENSKIEWTDHSWNPWWGCTKVSPGCDNCYAEAWAKRTGFPSIWGADAPRRFLSDSYWNGPFKWNAKAKKEGRRPRVFCASMADVFDNHYSVRVSRMRLWELIRSTPNLDWLVLTKRIGNAPRMLPDDWGNGYPNVWLGASIVNQDELDRDYEKLIEIPARIRFLSIEPMLAPVKLNRVMRYGQQDLLGTSKPEYPYRKLSGALHWVICGGESGSGARPMKTDWARNILDVCQRAEIAFFMKQGSQANWPHFKDFESFPEDLKVRQWPK